jgi:hypothetical protein
MPFEYFVRPFQSADSHGRVIIPSTPSGYERATLTWGAKVAGLPAPEQGGTNVDCCSEHLDELDRKSDRVTIVDPTTPENYLVVDRAIAVKLRKRKDDQCAGDWSQMSYVASAVESAFADLESDITAGGTGGKIDHCHQILHLTPNTVSPSADKP